MQRLEADVLAERQMAVTLIAAGASDVTVPSMAQERAEFDAALLAEPSSTTSSPDDELRRAMGL